MVLQQINENLRGLNISQLREIRLEINRLEMLKRSMIFKERINLNYPKGFPYR